MTEPTTGSLACLEVWGGNSRVTRDLNLPGLAAWVCSEPLAGSEEGGDLYYITLCSQGQLTRVGVADVSGHGEAVGRAAEVLRALMREHINALDQTELARGLNRAFEKESSRGRFATMLLMGLYRSTGELVFTNGGHPPPLWYRARRRLWTLLEEPPPDAAAKIADLPLGVIPGTRYHQFAVQLDLGDLVLAYSDALPESKNAGHEPLDVPGMLRLAGGLPVDSPAAAGRALLAAVRRYRGGASAADDQTVVALQRLAA